MKIVRIDLDFALGFTLELELDPDRDRLEAAWWTWCGLTFAEARIGQA